MADNIVINFPRPPAATAAKASRDDASIRVSVIVCYLGNTPSFHPQIAVLCKNTHVWGKRKKSVKVDVWGVANAKADRTDKKKSRLAKKKNLTIAERRRIAYAAAVRELPEETGLHIDDKDIKLRYVGKVPLPKKLSKRGHRFVYAAYVAGTPETHPIDLSVEHKDWQCINLDVAAAFLKNKKNVPDTTRRAHYGQVIDIFMQRAKKRLCRTGSKAVSLAIP